MKKYILIILVSILSFSCEKTLDFDEEGLAGKLVLNSIISTQKDFTASLNVTRSILEKTHGYSGGLLINGTIDIYINGNLSKTIESQTGYFTIKDFKPKPGDSYRIVLKSTGKQLEAETKIPLKAQVLSCDTLSVLNQFKRKSLNYKVKIKDLDGDDYYRILVTTESLVLNKNADGKGAKKYYRNISEKSISSEDPIFNSVYNNFGGDILSTGPKNSYNIFPDDYFKGKEYTIQFYPNNYGYGNYSTVSYGSGYGGNSTIETIYVRDIVHVQHLSKDLFMYIKYLNLYGHYSDNVFSEPVPMYSNIKNGIGVLAGFNDDARFMYEKIYRPFSMDTIKVEDNNNGTGYYYGNSTEIK